MKITWFEDIDAWKEARVLERNIYKITGSGKFIKDFGLRDQIQRASVSIMANLAEGFDRGSNKYFINFLNYSYSSASEVESLLYIAFDQNYILIENFELYYLNAEKIKKLIGGFIKYLKK